MPTVTLNPADVQNAQLGIDLPVAYGYVRAQGNEILNHALSNKNRVVIRMKAEGEWDGIERLFINGKIANAADTTLVHFHPGIDGVLGHGLTPDSNGGDQLVDNFWSLLPANFQPTTFSRKVYDMFNVPPDPAAPSATLTIMGDYRTSVVRQFDGFGTQTGYAFSTNGAEQCLDAIARTMLKPEWNPSAARAAGGDFVAAEKARINWASFADSVSWCNTLLANGQKRFESSIAFPQRIALIDALKQLCLMSQLYITEANGQIYICPDKPRTSTFLLKSDHIVPGTASFDKINLHGAPNRLVAAFNDLNAQGIADIDTVANSGLLRSGAGLVTVQTKTNHPFIAGQAVQIVAPQDGTAHDFAFDGVFPVFTLPAANKFTYLQSGNYNDLLWSEQLDNAVWVPQTGVTVTPNSQTDPLGGSTADTITTGSTAGVGLFQACALNSINGIQYTFSVWLKAAANTSVLVRINRSAAGVGSDTEGVTVTATNVWQRFTFTHSATWTGSQSVTALIQIVNASTSIFAWGAQLEDGSVATTYRQTTSATSGAVSGNGTVGTPESRFAVRSPVADHQQHQNAIGQRGLSLTPIFRVMPQSLSMGNNTAERVSRILNFLLARSLGINTTPYQAPWAGTVTCFMDAVDLSIGGNPRALCSQLCGDIITVDATVTEEYQGDYEITKADFIIPAADGSGSNGGGQTNAPTIDLTLMQYLPTAFSDTSLTALSVRAPIPSGLVPISQVDSLGVQRLAGTFRNNPVNTNGTFTGGNPLTQSGATPTILIASSTMQFGDGQISYSSGSVNPGVVGTFFIFGSDPSFQGGAIVYQFTTSKSIQVSGNGNVSFGQITTVSPGGGGTGSGGGGAGCFSGNTKVRVSNIRDGYTALSFDELTGTLIAIETEFGRRFARKHSRRYSGWMHDMGDGELVTPEHLIKVSAAFYDAAQNVWPDMQWYEGEVHTLETITNVDAERHFILGNGRTAHNLSPGL
jgi:hypothetical protein